MGKAIKNVRKHKDIKLFTTEKGRNYLVSVPKHYTTKFFTENVLVLEMKKLQIYISETVYLEL